jgi:hypothetical protein
MPASKTTVAQVAVILIEELGVEKAFKVVGRLISETKGNSSYRYTVQAIETELHKWKRGQR